MKEYAAVIQMAIEDNAGRSPEEITEAIIMNVSLAQRIMGRIPSSKGLILTPQQAAAASPPPPRLQEARSATSIPMVGIAPPVAGASPADNGGVTDHWASRPGAEDGPGRLREMLQKALPSSIEITIPGVSEPQSLQRHLDMPGFPMMFVKVRYSLPGQPMGPEVVVTTSEREFFADQIIRDIRSQAAASYGVDRRAIAPVPGKPIPMPSDADIARLAVVDGDSVSGDDAMRSREIASAWGASRDPKYRD